MKKVQTFEEFINESDILEGKSFTFGQIKFKAEKILRGLGISRPDKEAVKETIQFLKNMIEKQKSGTVFE